MEIAKIDDNYSITNTGKLILSKTGEEVKVYTNSAGYFGLMSPNILTNEKERAIHRLVYKYFIGDIEDGMVIDHINSNKKDNNVENLRQITHAQNLLRQEKTYSVKAIYNIKNNEIYLTDNLNRFSKEHSLDSSALYKVLKGKITNSNGYYIIYANDKEVELDSIRNVSKGDVLYEELLSRFDIKKIRRAPSNTAIVGINRDNGKVFCSNNKNKIVSVYGFTMSGLQYALCKKVETRYKNYTVYYDISIEIPKDSFYEFKSFSEFNDQLVKA